MYTSHDHLISDSSSTVDTYQHASHALPVNPATVNLYTRLQIIHAIIFPVHTMIFVVYWGIIHATFLQPLNEAEHLLNMSMHALNFFMVLVEFSLNQQCIHLGHIVYVNLAGVLYFMWNLVSWLLFNM